METLIRIPSPALVLIVGPSGSGKSTLVRRLFLPREVVSSDACRALVADDESDQTANRGAFRILRTIVAERLRHGRTAVVDATNVTTAARRGLLKLAAGAGRPAVAIILDVPLEVCLERNLRRSGRTVDESVVRRQHADFRRSLGSIPEEGFASVFMLGHEVPDALTVIRERVASLS
jgi:protein phosphatase